METQTATETKERPTFFNSEMVRKILSGEKTQTRRVVKNSFAQNAEYVYQHESGLEGRWWAFVNQSKSSKFMKDGQTNSYCPFGKVGTRLWVRETFANFNNSIHYIASANQADLDWLQSEAVKWKPSIFMPREASRITLEITDIRVERLLDISNSDARSEGVCGVDWGHGLDYGGDANYTKPFSELWDKINGKKYPVSSNPWVWCISFQKLENK